VHRPIRHIGGPAHQQQEAPPIRMGMDARQIAVWYFDARSARPRGHFSQCELSPRPHGLQRCRFGQLVIGASPRDIMRLVLRQAGVLAIVGLAAGTAATLVLARTLSSLLFGVPPWDPATLASAGGLLALATLAASYLPARRAARVDPASILASE